MPLDDKDTSTAIVPAPAASADTGLTNPPPSTLVQTISPDGSKVTKVEDHSGFFGYLNNRQQLQAESEEQKRQHELDKAKLDTEQRAKDQEHERLKQEEENRHKEAVDEAANEHERKKVEEENRNKEVLDKQAKQHESDKAIAERNERLAYAGMGTVVSLGGIGYKLYRDSKHYEQAASTLKTQEATAARLEKMYGSLAAQVTGLETVRDNLASTTNLSKWRTLKQQIQALLRSIPDTDPAHATPLKARLAQLLIAVDATIGENTPIDLSAPPEPVLQFSAQSTSATFTSVPTAPMPSAPNHPPADDIDPFADLQGAVANSANRTATNLLQSVAQGLKDASSGIPKAPKF